MLWFRSFCLKLCCIVVMAHTLIPADQVNLCKFKDSFACRGCARIARLHKVILSKSNKEFVEHQKNTWSCISSEPLFAYVLASHQNWPGHHEFSCENVCLHSYMEEFETGLYIFEFLNGLRDGLHRASRTTYVICVSTIIAWRTMIFISYIKL